ncbi:ADP-ribosylglycohydrolase family protein [Roseovarius sp. SCSIO 43702]|uniref:ADP-ribosylglycohydrolase family protein n=1 Tax=Roseovarius sp. SCSIO 43702 TaxID=2823043 RepID=UPI001C72A5F1|nr:ADP-ribosylglycohydrolase family protein [Roseovarius sp. SCSIO 43702]QYX57931.1 ADP-ribosylglycohydrolase family protein [Roseovarius sp. SCSIO 43702]
MMRKPFSEDQAHGMLVGLAVGEGIAARASGRSGPPDGTMPLAPAPWASVTSQTFCIAQMLRSANGWDAEDAMKRLINWRDFGYLAGAAGRATPDSETGAALAAFEATGNPYGAGDSAGRHAALAVARVAPVVLAYGAMRESAMAVAQLQARLTHPDRPSQAAAANLAEVLASGDRGLMPRPDAPSEPVSEELRSTLHAAFWALAQADTFPDAMEAIARLDGETRAAGAIVGQVAGRLWGYAGIPESWREALHDHDKILVTADDLHAMRPIDV